MTERHAKLVAERHIKLITERERLLKKRKFMNRASDIFQKMMSENIGRELDDIYFKKRTLRKYSYGVYRDYFVQNLNITERAEEMGKYRRIKRVKEMYKYANSPTRTILNFDYGRISRFFKILEFKSHEFKNSIINFANDFVNKEGGHEFNWCYNDGGHIIRKREINNALVNIKRFVDRRNTYKYYIFNVLYRKNMHSDLVREIFSYMC
jgi:hypothetical protein